jgi:hypothetical protein
LLATVAIGLFDDADWLLATPAGGVSDGRLGEGVTEGFATEPEFQSAGKQSPVLFSKIKFFLVGPD